MNATRRRGLIVMAASLVAAGLSAQTAPMRSTPASNPLQRAEAEIKAAYLFKFLGFVEWPASAFNDPAAPLVLGLLGAPMMAQALESLVVERQVSGRPVALRALAPDSETRGLHALFVGRDQTSSLPALLARRSGQALLIVTEAEPGPAAGSVINFVVVQDRVRFDVALHVAERQRLRISARLLAVARHVETSP